jgi:hypothetical protein
VRWYDTTLTSAVKQQTSIVVGCSMWVYTDQVSFRASDGIDLSHMHFHEAIDSPSWFVLKNKNLRQISCVPCSKSLSQVMSTIFQVYSDITRRMDIVVFIIRTSYSVAVLPTISRRSTHSSTKFRMWCTSHSSDSKDWLRGTEPLQCYTTLSSTHHLLSLAAQLKFYIFSNQLNLLGSHLKPHHA